MLNYIFALAAVAAADSAMTDSIEKAWNLELDQVVVTATRTPKLLKDSPVITRLISAPEIAKTDPTDISDLLEAELPGVEFSFSMNQQTAINMQGFGGKSVLFLIDGEPLAGETLDNVDYNRLNLNDVGRIEIVKGGASALYGSNAVGGVVNIISADRDGRPWHLDLGTRYGSHNEQRYSLNLGLEGKKLRSVTSVQFHSIDSYDMKNAGDFSRFYGGHNWNFKERLEWRITDRFSLTGRAGYYFRQRNSASYKRDRYRDFTAGLRAVCNFSQSDNLEMSYGFDQYDKSDFRTQTGLDVRNYRNVQNSLRAIYSHSFSKNYILTGGADMMYDYLQSYQFTGGGHKNQTTADVFAQIDLTPVRNFNVVAGGRYDYFSEAGMNHVSSRLSLMYRPARRWALRGSYAGGFRAPTLKEMYMDFDMAGIFMIYGNPDLKAETSHNFQLSAEWSTARFNINFGGFCNLVDNRITTAWSRDLNGQVYTNIGRVTIAGADANASWRHPLGFGARLSYCYTAEHVRKGEPYTSSTRPHTATVRLDYTRDWKPFGISAALSGRVLSAVTVDEFVSSTSYEETESVRYPAYTMWKLNLSANVWHGVAVTFAIDNLFNYIPKYYYSNSPATTGTTFMAGLTVKCSELFKK